MLQMKIDGAKSGDRNRPLWSTRCLIVAIPISGLLGLVACAVNPPAATPVTVADMAAICVPEALQSVASRLSIAVTVKTLPQEQIPGPFLPGGARYTSATATMPAFCQVTGSYVTNPQTGKTANFLATFPTNWNGKYLQLGCGGHCGTFAVSDPATPLGAVATQGKPGDVIAKGYATFATDQGHVGLTSGAWAIKGAGQIDQEAVADLLYRAQQVLTRMGKEFTRAFYAEASGLKPRIARSYFSGCSGGGRDAMVAASYFPEEFDGIIAGSPYANMVGTAFQAAGVSAATLRSEGADVPPELVAQIDPIVKAKCDAIDGVKDGLIQNPAACDFRPERDLPRCAGDKPGSDCFTQVQVETMSAVLTAVTDEHGNIVYPGYSVSEVQPAFRMAERPDDLDTLEPWPDTGDPANGGMGALANATLKVFAHENDPDFHTRSLLSFGAGGSGQVTGYRVIVPRAEVEFAQEKLRMGIGAIPENVERLLRHDHKLMIWSNLSDELLTPYLAINYYKRLAAIYGGYDKLQENIRLFALPGTGHCSAGLNAGLGSFDALTAMENWVEKGEAPNGLIATQYAPTPLGVDFNKPLGRTMPLCKFPEMAKYKGRGNINDAGNWYCPEDDKRMLERGESGIQAGVIP